MSHSLLPRPVPAGLEYAKARQKRSLGSWPSPVTAGHFETVAFSNGILLSGHSGSPVVLSAVRDIRNRRGSIFDLNLNSLGAQWLAMFRFLTSVAVLPR